MTFVRIAQKEDIEKISYVLASSWKTAYREIVHDDYLNALKNNHWVEFLTTGLSKDSLFSMVIENDQEIVGAAILSKTEEEHEVNLISFYLLPDIIGQGFGHTLYCAIETEMRSRGFLNCIIDVLDSNTRAIHFYEAHGFIDTNKEINAVLGEHNYTCKVFMKSL